MATLFGHLSVQIQDALGVVASVPYYLEYQDTATIAEINTAAAGILTVLDTATDGQIISASFDLAVPLPTVKTAPVAGSEVERGGLLNFRQQAVKYRFGVLIPALAATAIVNGKIDLSSGSPVTAFINLIETIGGDLDWISTGGRLLSTFSDALITFRKHRKAESRRSFEVE